MSDTRRMRSSFLFLTVGFILLQTAISPAAIITSSINQRKLSVGDLLHLSVDLIIPKGATVIPPETESSFGAVTVKEWDLSKNEREKSDSLHYNYIVTTYTPEPCTIPALSFILDNSGETDTLKTEPVPLQLISVVTSDTADIIGLKSPLIAGKAPRWWLWLAGIAAALAAIIFGILFIAKRLRKTPPPPPPVPPYEEAIDALRSLGTKKYLQRGLVREYVFELSEIFKRYVGRRFVCNAVEFTTEEMIAWSGAADLPKTLRASIDWFFRTTDPVKFARLIPDSATIDRFEKEVRDFLEATKPLTDDKTDAATDATDQPDGATTSATEKGRQS